MGNFIGGLIGNVLDLVVTCILLSFVLFLYCKKNNKFFKKPWLLVLAIIFFFNLVGGIVHLINFYQEEKLPNIREVHNKLKSDENYVTEDFVFSSKFGFKVLIPKGYKYLEMNKKAPLLLVNIDRKDGSIVSFDKTGNFPSVETIYREIKKSLAKSENNYEFQALVKPDNGTPPHFAFFFTREGRKCMGEMFIMKEKNKSYGISTSCLILQWENNKDEFQRIVKSFKFIDSSGKEQNISEADDTKAKDKLHLAIIIVGDEDIACKIHQSLLSGEAFDKLAEKYSKGPNTADGGDIGLMRPSELHEKVRFSVENLQKNQITDVIKTDNGFYILKRL